MDASTVYIENFPNEMTNEDMAKVFKRAGIIRHISMPTFKDKQPKGFCFIEYGSLEQAESACRLFNNCVPEEFTNSACENYIQFKNNTQAITQLRVMLKAEWTT